MALDVLPTYEPALEALGRILWRQGDWDGLIDMYKAEIHVLPQGERRALRLFDLGELQATFANRPDEALSTFQLLTKEDPEHQDALRWLERLYEKTGRPKDVVNVLEKRMCRVEPEDRASLSLKGATLAEWALSDGPRAWHFYVGALGDSATRAHAVNGLFRLWNQVIEDGDALVSALVELDKVVLGEKDPSVLARIHILKSILEKGGRTLTEWSIVRDTLPDDLMTMAACEVLASTRGDLDDLATIRRGTHLGGLWALISQMDGTQAEQEPDMGWLPDNKIVDQILAELDLNIVRLEPVDIDKISDDQKEQPGRNGDDSLTTFRRLVRAWSDGCHRLQEITEDASIPALRLSTQAALTVGDLAEASRLTELEAGSWSCEESTQRRLTLAAELRHEADVSAARDLFSKSIEVGCYGEPSRTQLYEVLERLGELDLLIEALELHITSLEKDKDRRVWLSKLAEVYEQNGDRNGAMASWKEVIERFPKDAAAVLEQVRLFCLEQLPEEAAHLIEETLKEKVFKKDRIKLLSRLSEVHIDEELKTTRAISALEEACKLSGNKNSWKRRLAKVHYQHGDGARGLNLLVESLPSTPSEADLEDWFIMARIKYERLDDKDSAREMLWGLLERFTDNMDTLRELETFYRSVGEASDLAERLTTLLIDQPVELESTTISFLWEYVGDLNFQVLKRYRDAQVAFDSSMDSGGDISRLSLKSARAMGRQAGKGLEASRAFSSALRLENINKEDWCSSVHELESIFEQLEDQARLRVVKQVRDLFEERPFSVASDARIKRDPARTLDMTLALEGLTDGLVTPDSIELIHYVAPIIHHCFRGRRPKKRTLGARRIKGDDQVKFMQQVQLSADVLGLKTPKIYEGGVGERPEILNNGSHFIPTKVFIYNNESECSHSEVNEMVSSLPENIWSRFWAGQTVGIDAFGWESLGLAEPGEIERLLDAIMSWEQGDRTALSTQFKKACSGRFKKQRAEIFRLLTGKPNLMDAVSRESWMNLPTLIADRFGLLMTGDVRVAVLAIQYLTSDCCSLPYHERLVAEERTSRLLDFGLSMAYQEIRYHCGLAARPRTV
jgi:tetratricopeptide (TPR) repeat protein